MRSNPQGFPITIKETKLNLYQFNSNIVNKCYFAEGNNVQLQGKKKKESEMKTQE